MLSTANDARYHQLLSQIDRLITEKLLVIIAIDGSSGSGKTELARQLRQRYDANVFHMDDFFLQPHQRTNVRLEEIGGNVDYERFKAEVLEQISKSNHFSYQKYDCQLGRLTDFVQVTSKPVNIVEGVYSMHPTLIGYYHFKVFLTVSRDLQLERIGKRSGEVLLERFIKEWIPKEDEYFRYFGVQEQADLVIDTSNFSLSPCKP